VDGTATKKLSRRQATQGYNGPDADGTRDRNGDEKALAHRTALQDSRTAPGDADAAAQGRRTAATLAAAGRCRVGGFGGKKGKGTFRGV
jgi:hypothetical protein